MKLVLPGRTGFELVLSKVAFSSIVAVLFHAAGLIGNLFFASPFITNMTPIHLLLMGFLVFYSCDFVQRNFIMFGASVGVLGFTAEYVGVHTGLLFGDYEYGTVLGPDFRGVPWLIAVNWFVVVLGAAALMNVFVKQQRGLSKIQKQLFIIIGGALLATALDWMLEPVAIELGYWQWAGSEIPIYNYVCWFVISLLCMVAFVMLKPHTNYFHALLFLAQMAFFTIMRLALPLNG